MLACPCGVQHGFLVGLQVDAVIIFGKFPDSSTLRIIHKTSSHDYRAWSRAAIREMPVGAQLHPIGGGRLPRPFTGKGLVDQEIIKNESAGFSRTNTATRSMKLLPSVYFPVTVTR